MGTNKEDFNDLLIKTKDSGERQVFETGCQRDTQNGKGRFDLIPPFALMRLAGVYQRGAAKYDDNNWVKGMPYGRVLDSALRHLFKWKFRKVLGLPMDEDHLGQAAWNIFTLMEYELIHPDLDNIKDLYKNYTKQDIEKMMKVINQYIGGFEE